jgi:hypothetical protein
LESKTAASKTATQSLTVLLPTGMIVQSKPAVWLDVLRPISLQLDLEYSDAFVRDNRHKISPELYEAYKRLRNSL